MRHKAVKRSKKKNRKKIKAKAYRKKSSYGKTILFSTHQMEQVERLCTNICLINKGKIIIEGSLASVKQSHRSNAVDVRFSGELNSEKAKTYFSDVKIEGAS